jgi:hypothetical protein
MLSSLKKLFQFCDDNFFLFSKLKLKNIFCFYFMDNLGLQNGDKKRQKTPKNSYAIYVTLDVANKVNGIDIV